MPAVVLHGSAGTAAVGVERFIGTAEIVLRSLPEFAPAERIVAGASLDVEGQPQLVLDADGLIEAALRASPQAPAQPDRKRPVLVIDDSLTTRMLEQSILESAGYLVDVAASAEEGLEKAHLKRYALFLVDVEMPGMNGFSFIERIRADAVLRDIPAILVTSLASEESMRQGEAAGAQGYMIKSEFDQSRLLGLIARLTERQDG
jgi:two-component system chemotaxis sensor kinase CheA